MAKIVEYWTVSETDVDDFSREVTSLINMGYQPYGSPYALGVHFCQALVKYEDGQGGQDGRGN